MDTELEIEDRARQMGWVPLEQFKGSEDKWVDAETFVERGEQVLPILRANNHRLHNDLLTLQSQNGTLQQELTATRTIVRGLEKSFNESLQRQLAEQRAQLKASLKEAVEDRDIDRELEVREQLGDLATAEQEAKRKQLEVSKPVEPVTTDPTKPNLSPEFNAWQEANPWYGVDRKKTKAVLRAAEDLRDDGDTSIGLEFMNKALAIVEAAAGEGSEVSSVDKVSSGSSRNGTRAVGKSYAALPSEAKAACEEDLVNFVGEGKLFKTEKDWRDYYAKTYFGEG